MPKIFARPRAAGPGPQVPGNEYFQPETARTRLAEPPFLRPEMAALEQMFSYYCDP